MDENPSFDPEKTEYVVDLGVGEEDPDKSRLPRIKAIEEHLKERYELIHGDLDSGEVLRHDNGVWITSNNRGYYNLKHQLPSAIIEHDDLAAAVGELDFLAIHGGADELPIFGRKFSVNDLARPLLLATLLKDETPNSVVKVLDDGEYVEDLNLSKVVSQSSLSGYGGDVSEFFNPYCSRLQDDVIEFVQGTKHEELVPPPPTLAADAKPLRDLQLISRDLRQRALKFLQFKRVSTTPLTTET